MTAAPAASREARAARALARGRRIDALIPGILLNSPLSHAGFVFATVVGFCWGGLLSQGRVERHDGLWVFRGMPSWAYGRGGTCVGACFLTGERMPSHHVLVHERVHVVQWRRYGMLLPVLYQLSGRDPLGNRFEIEAGLEDGGYVRRGA